MVNSTGGLTSTVYIYIYIVNKKTQQKKEQQKVDHGVEDLDTSESVMTATYCV